MSIQQGKTHTWTKSSYSTGNGACVEVKSPQVRSIAVRDSKEPQGPALSFRSAAWDAFVSRVSGGELGSGLD
ncbi:DUF397 domain-containing protein [Streptomyces reniochalinae]|uniref:DUF397 domain-containing protein n=1 Tax=Streptomyces reniochalinae TaxID=2250578 RepID=A0A367EJ16_9ACTN|nr:DUF397 domain-containing protein [Streptomyces reniochalinae]RCG17943.1 DUF397 domain-containing protein [Streptomyces reniochalinae]